MKKALAIGLAAVMAVSMSAPVFAEAISQGDEHYVIDADACLDCGTCADACPTEAIHPAE